MTLVKICSSVGLTKRIMIRVSGIVFATQSHCAVSDVDFDSPFAKKEV